MIPRAFASPGTSQKHGIYSRSRSRRRADRRRTLGFESLETRRVLDAEFGFALGFGDTGVDMGRAVTTDNTGNVYVAGSFNRTVDFNPGGGVNNLTSAGFTDAFMAKYSPAGELLWARQFGGTSNDFAFAITVDDAGYVYTAGTFYGTVDFDPGAGTVELTSTGFSFGDVFITKFDVNGNLVWAKGIGGQNSESVNSLTVDHLGNVYSTGNFASVVDFDPGPGTFNLTSASSNDIFVSKLNSAGDFVWAARWGSSNGGTTGVGIANDANGHVYITGSFRNTVDFDPGPSIQSRTSNGGVDLFVLKLDPAGKHVWTKQIGGPQDEAISAIAVDNLGNAYTTGYFLGTVDFNPDAAISDLSAVGGQDVFVSKLDSSGNFAWARQMGGSSLDKGLALTVDDSGNVYSSGSFRGTVDFNPGTGVLNLVSAGDADVFISKLDTSGGFVWARNMGGVQTDEAFGIAVGGAANNVYTTGYLTGTADFDPGSGTFNLTSAGGADVFLSKLAQASPIIPDTEVSIDALGNLVVNDLVAKDDTLSVRFDGTNGRYLFHDASHVLKAGVGATQVSANSVAVPLSSVSGQLMVHTGDGQDILTIDFSAGSPIPSAGLRYEGGEDINEIQLINGDFDTTLFSYGTNNQATISLDPNGNQAPLGLITFLDVTKVTSDVESAEVNFDFAGPSESITIGSTQAKVTTIESSLGTITTFINPESILEIATRTSSDQINLNGLASDYPSIAIRADGASDAVYLNGSTTFATGHGLTISDVGTIHVAGAVIESTDADVNLTAFIAVNMEPGSSITVTGGDINIGANTSGEVIDPLSGIMLDGATLRTLESGNITLNGVVIDQALSSSGIQLVNNASIIATNGSVTLITDSLDLGSTASIHGANVTLKHHTHGVAIDVGGSDAPLVLGLSEAELDSITATQLIIGDSHGGTVTIKDDVTRNQATDVEFRSGQAIVFDSGRVDTAGGDLVLAAGVGGVHPRTVGNDADANSIAMGPELQLTVQGPHADTHYNRFMASGDINIQGTDLRLTGDYAPVPGDSFTVLSATRLIGRFNGLDDGNVITFNGMPLTVRYSETGVTLTYVTTLSFLEASREVAEGIGTITVHATLGTALTKDVSVPVSVGGTAQSGIDFNISDAVIHIPAGNLHGTLAIEVADDYRSDASETIDLTIPQFWSGGPVIAGSVAEIILTIIDDEPVALAPQADVGGPYVVEEGTLIQLDASATVDNGQPRETLSFEWDLDYDGINFQSDATGIRPEVSFNDDAEARPIAVRVRDADDLMAIASTTVRVINVPPTIVSVVQNGPVAKDSPVTLTVSSSDPANSRDPLLYEFDFDADGLYEFSSQVGIGTHTYGTLGSYPVAIRVSDGDGGVVTTDTTVVVMTTVGFSQSSSSVSESSGTVEIAATLGEVLPDDLVVRLFVSGTATSGYFPTDPLLEIPAGSLSGSVRLQLSDDYRSQGERTIVLTIPTGWTGQTVLRGNEPQHVLTILDNEPPATPPIPSAGGPYVGNEGAEMQLDASQTSDAGQPSETLLYEWDLDYDGESFEVDALGRTPRVTFGDDTAHRVIAVRVQDADHLTAISTSSVRIENVPPTISQIISNGPVAVGDTVQVSVNASDPGRSHDPLIYEFDFDDDGIYDALSPNPIVTHTYPHSGFYNIPIRVTDSDGGIASSSITVTVWPTVTLKVATSEVSEESGQPLVVVAELNEVASSNVHVAFQLRGTAFASSAYKMEGHLDADNLPNIDAFLRIPAGSQSGSVTITPVDDYRYDPDETIEIRLAGGTPVPRGITVQTITIRDNEPSPTPPVAHAGGPYSIAEREFLQLDASSTIDLGQPPASLYYEWDLNYDGATFDADTHGINPIVQFMENSPATTIGLRVTDADGLSTIATGTVTVTNRPPVITLLQNSTSLLHTGPVGRNEVFSVTVTGFDGPLDPLDFWFDFDGDGVFDEFHDTDDSNPTITTTHAFSTAGHHDVRVLVRDDEGDFAEGTTSVVVLPRVTFSAASQTVDEHPSSEITIRAELNEPAVEEVSIRFAISGSVDLSDYDFDAPSIVIPAGATQAATTLTILDDRYIDPGEQLILTMQLGGNVLPGALTTHIIEITDDDRPPVPHAGGPYTAFEAEQFQLDGSASFDVNQSRESLTYEWDLDYDGATFNSEYVGVRPNIIFGDNFASRTIAVRVTDSGGASATSTTTLEIVNLPPEITALSDNGPVAPGSPVTITVAANDAAGSDDPLTYEFDFNNDGLYDTAGPANAVSHTYSQNGNYVVGVRVTDGDGGQVLTTTTVSVAPAVEFTATNQPDVTEGAGHIVIQAQLAQPQEEEVRVPLFPSGTIEWDDYSVAWDTTDPASVLLVIPPGELSGEVIITLNDDTRDEEDDVLIFTMGRPSGASLGSVAVHSVIVKDNDVPPSVSLYRNPFPWKGLVHEASSLPIIANLSHLSDFLVTVPVIISGDVGPGDYSWTGSSGGFITVPPGLSSNTPWATTLHIADDSEAERIERITVSLGEPVNATLPEYFTTVSGMIDVSDMPQASVRTDVPWESQYSEQAAGELTFRVDLSMASDRVLQVPFEIVSATSLVRGLDYELIGAGPSYVEFQPGVTSVAVKFKIINDDLAERSEEFGLILRDSSAVAVTGYRQQSVATQIRDDDSVNVAIDVHSTSVWEDHGNVPVTIALSNPAAFPYNLLLTDFSRNEEYRIWHNGVLLERHFDSSASEDYFIVPVPVGVQDIDLQIEIIDDSVTEYGDDVSLYVERSSNAPSGEFHPNRNVRIDIRDNDPWVGFIQQDTSIDESNPTGSMFIGLFHRNRYGDLVATTSNKPVSVTYSYFVDTAEPRARLGDDYSLCWPQQPASQVCVINPHEAKVTVPPGFSSFPIQVGINQDTRRERNERFELFLDDVTNAWFNSEVVSRRQLATIKDDDFANVSISTSLQEVTEGVPFEVVVSLDRPPAPGEEVHVDLLWNPLSARQGGTEYGTDDFRFTNTTLVFGSENVLEKRVVVPTIDDIAIERAREEIGFRLSNVRTLIHGELTDPAGARISTAKSTVGLLDNDKVANPTIPAGTVGVGTEAVTHPREHYENEGSPEFPQPLGPHGGSGGGGGSVPPSDPSAAPSEPILTGTIGIAVAADGYIADGVVFFDANRNGQFDFLDLNGDRIRGEDEPREIAFVTDGDGTFAFSVPPEFDTNDDGRIDWTEGQLVVVGGMDTALQLPSQVSLRAPIGMYAISPLTTVVADLVNAHAFTLDAAIARARTSLSLPESHFARSSFIYEAKQGDVDARVLFATSARLHNTVVQWANFLSGLPGAPSVAEMGNHLYAHIAQRMSESASAIDLGDRVFQQLLAIGVLESQRLELDSDTLKLAAEIIAAGNAVVNEAESGVDLVEKVAKAQVVAQGVVSQELKKVALGEKNISTVYETFTGSNLTIAIQGAAIGNVLPVLIRIVDAEVIERNDGSTVAEFHVIPSHASEFPVTVDYTTFDMDASSSDGDYTPVAGTLKWTPGDLSPRSIQVPVHGDNDFESDESFGVFLSNPTNASLRRREGIGTIVNDDSFDYQPPDDGEDNLYELFVSGEIVQLTRNNEFIVSGAFSRPVSLRVSGGTEVVNTLNVSVDSDVTALPHVLSFIGSGQTDHVRLMDLEAASSIHRRIHSGEGTLWLDGVELQFDGLEQISNELVPVVMGVDEPFIAGRPVKLSASTPSTVQEADIQWDVMLGDALVAFGSGSEFQFTPTTAGVYTLHAIAEREDFGRGEFVAVLDVAANPNQPPSELKLQNAVSSLPENTDTSAGLELAEIRITDDGLGTNVLTLSGLDAAYFEIVGTQLMFKACSALDYEAKSSYAVTINVNDPEVGLTPDLSIDFTLLLLNLDESPPRATINPLPLSWATGTIALDVALLDPAGPGDEPISGVESYRVYFAVESGGWQLLADNLPASQTRVNFTASSNLRYWFRAVAVDVAGNVELEPSMPTAEANTKTLDVDPPSTHASFIPPEDDKNPFGLQLNGTDAGGSGLQQFHVYVSIDGGAPVPIVGSPFPAGTPHANGAYTTSASYYPLRDNVAHTYQFFSRGVDGKGNLEPVPETSDFELTRTLAAPSTVQATAIDVQNGEVQRSFVRYVDILFNVSAGLDDLVSSGGIRVERFALDTASPDGAGTIVSSWTTSVYANSIQLDFGSGGLGGVGSSGDGFYRISIDLDGNDQFDDDAHFEFFRLFGDADGDGVVETSDQNSINEDLNGDRRVDTRDRRDARNQLGKMLDSALLSWLDD